jgi:GNAT superfamily N-acetyltransferase
MTLEDALKTLKIRQSDYTDADYDTFAAIRNAALPEHLTTGSLQRFRRESRDQRYPDEHFLLENDGQVVGTGWYFQSPYAYMPGKFEVVVHFHPTHQSVDAFAAGFALMLPQLEPFNPTRIGTAAQEDETHKFAYLTSNGYRETLRENESRLSLADFNFADWAATHERFAASGLRMLSAADVQREHPDDWMRRLYELDNTLSKDVPSTGEVTAPDFESYARQLRDDPEFDPELWILAADGETLVAVTMVYQKAADPSRYENGLTGVLKAYRRRGIARAIKTESLRRVKARGGKSILTGNEMNNPMYQLNVQLGFTPQPATVFFEKVLVTD